MTAPSYLTEEELAAQQQAPFPSAPPAPSLPGAPEVPGSAPTLGAAPQAPGAAPQAPAYPTVAPPPPQPPDLQGITGQVAQYSSDWMNNANPYLSPLATATRDASNARLGQAESEARRKIDEYAASRGLTGSSYEGEQVVDLQAELQRARGEDERALLNMLAEYETLGRQAAGNMGLSTVDALNRQREFDVTAGFTERDLDQRAQQVMNEGRALDLQEARDIASRELAQAELGQRESEFTRSLTEAQTERLARYGLSGQQLELETQRLQQQAELEGRSLDITEATNQAEIGLRAQQLVQEAQLQGRALDIEEARNQATQDIELARMAQEGRQFEASLIQRSNEFASTIGLSREQFEAQTAQFQQQFGEQVASRLQQNEQFTAALESDEARNALSVGLQSRALDLQEAGMTMEDAWRQASLDQERTLTTRAQDLQELGISNEDAYRYAALEQDGDFKTEALRLEELGLNMEDSYREAEQALQMRQLDISQQEVDQRADTIKQGDRSLDLQESRDLAQLELAREEMDFRVRMQENELTQRESEFARSIGLDEREFIERQDQFVATFGEQVQSRLQQDTQFARALESDEARSAVDAGLRRRALDLQAQGMTMDQAFREASLWQERELTLGAQALQAQGLAQEDAYRYAALSQDARFTQEAQRLQEMGMTMDDAYRQASLNLQERQVSNQENQFQREMDFKVGQAKTDNERLQAMLEIWQEYYGKSKTGGDPSQPIINVIGGTGGGGGGGEGPIGDYPTVPTESGEPWTWDADKQTWVDGDGNEYEE